MKLQCVWRCKF
ncbi:hypothetical protein O1D30_003554 [Vibrio cholerae]|nr:hypothetical protein [Vibrio cholerae]